jgi:WD40 repeat protein
VSSGSAAPRGECPFPGLAAFEERDGAFFFGRRDVGRIVTANLRAAPLTVLYGARAVGKSSLLHVGVVGALRAEQRAARADAGADGGADGDREPAPFAVATIGSWVQPPLPVLVDRLAAAVAEALGAPIAPPRAGEPLLETLAGWTRQVTHLYLVLDQFEEYFLYHPPSRDESSFDEALTRILAAGDLRVNVLVSMREDALFLLDRFKTRVPGLWSNTLQLGHLDRASAREAIEGPIRAFNELHPASRPYSAEPELVEALLDARGLRARADRAAAGRELAVSPATAPSIETSYLQLVMRRLWFDPRTRGSHRLSLGTLDAIGGPSRIVRGHLDGAMADLSPQDKELATALFLYLVTPSQSKIAYTAADLAAFSGRDEPVVERLLESLADVENRVLRRISPAPADAGPGADDRAPRYELFHDVLAPAVREWRTDQTERRLRRERVHKRVYRTLAVIGLLSTITLVVLLVLTSRRQADEQQRAALSRSLAARAASAATTSDAETAALVGIEARRLSKTFEARSLLLGQLRPLDRRSGSLQGGRAIIDSVAYSADGGTVASAGDDGVVRIWRPKGPRRSTPATIRAGSAVYAVALGADGRSLAYAGADARVHLWDTRAGRAIGAPLAGHRHGVRALAFRADGRFLASGGDDATVRLWDLRRGRVRRRTLRGHTDFVTDVAFSPDGRTVASASADGTVRRWSVATGRRHGEPLRPRAGTINALAYEPGGSGLVLATARGLRRWSFGPGGGRLTAPGAGTENVEDVAWSADGAIIAYAPDRGPIVLMAPRGPRTIGVLRGHSGLVASLAFGAGGAMLASAGEDQRVRLWDTALDHTVQRPLPTTVPAIGVAWSPDASKLAVAEVGGSVRTLDRAGSRTREPVLLRLGGAFALRFLDEGATLAAVGTTTMQLWNLKAGRRIRAVRLASGATGGATDSIKGVAFSPDGGLLAATDRLRTVLWNVRTGRRLGPLTGDVAHSDRAVAFSPSAGIVAAGGADDAVYIWDVRSRRRRGEALRGHRGPVTSLAFSPDGTILATGSYDRTVRLWSMPEGRAMGTLQGHDTEVLAVAFSPDAKTLASAGFGGVVRLWDVGSKRLLGKPLGGHPGDVDDLAFSPDGTALASTGDGAITLWDSLLWSGDDAVLAARVCDAARRSLTREQWTAFLGDRPYRATCG